MNKIDLQSLKQIALQVDQINTSLDAVRNTDEYSDASFQSFKGIDEYLTTAIMLIEEVIKNETANNNSS